eukprot:TRINITY_DN11778_c0_g1_i3.p1 TRINITY_DN11778_c0_g1~~TRINITY_DN11778_c0_g1_i3.p1  ORF type:complete len:186 (-),score=45.46 TRINITY_DN11778_c0_g1_i3:276-833(-)
MMRRPPRSTLSSSSAASDVYKRQPEEMLAMPTPARPAKDIEMNSNTRVRCTVENFRGTKIIVSSRKLWHKYGEKVILFTRHQNGCTCSSECRYILAREQKAAQAGSTEGLPPSLRFRRAYLKCFQKGCPAKMIVDADVETNEELAPVISCQHTHEFEVIPEQDSMNDMLQSVNKRCGADQPALGN